MYIPSSKKDVVLTIIICVFTIALALTWNSGRIAKDELEITKAKLANCVQDLKQKTERVESLRIELDIQRMQTRENNLKVAAVPDRILPLLAQYNAIMDMLMRRIKNGEVPEPIVREYLQIVKQ